MKGKIDKHKKIDIQPHHVEQLYGVMISQMLHADTLVSHMYSTLSWFNHNAPAVDSRLCPETIYKI